MRTLAMALTALLLAGCSDQAPPDETGGATSAGDVAVGVLRVGDCLQTPADGVVTELAAVPCSEPHDGEVFHSFALPDGPFPGAGQLQALAEPACVEPFEAFVGQVFDDSALRLLPLTPVEQGWDAGDRTVRCVVQDEQGGLTATLRGAAR